MSLCGQILHTQCVDCYHQLLPDNLMAIAAVKVGSSTYKAPKKFLGHNMEFNNHVSMLQIHSEHAIGFLKGQFHSLKGLWV